MGGDDSGVDGREGKQQVEPGSVQEAGVVSRPLGLRTLVAAFAMVIMHRYCLTMLRLPRANSAWLLHVASWAFMAAPDAKSPRPCGIAGFFEELCFTAGVTEKGGNRFFLAWP